jgi:6-hydroxynicotinate 3-monooxygenase
MQDTDIAIVGAGLGGLVAGLLLLEDGHDVRIYEQASSFSRLGAGIQLGPNVLKIMRRLGLEQQVEAMGSKPDAWVSRNGPDAALLADIPLNRRRQFYGAAYVTIHRGDFHRLLVDAFPTDRLHYDQRLVSLDDSRGAHTVLQFADGLTVNARIVIGADGVNSVVREALLGPEKPLYTGYVGHRAIFPAAALKGLGFEGGLDFEPCVKWWTDDRHIMVYYLDDAQEEMYYVTGAPEPSWNTDAASVESSREEMHAAFADYHPIVHAMIDASREVSKWPLLTRPPLTLWHQGRVVLLGDACHPMKPHMAQGAAMAIEDAAMLARCLGESGGLDKAQDAFALYSANRIERASRVQKVSNANTWLRTNENPDWVYAYEVLKVPLVPASS